MYIASFIFASLVTLFTALLYYIYCRIFKDNTTKKHNKKNKKKKIYLMMLMTFCLGYFINFNFIEIDLLKPFKQCTPIVNFTRDNIILSDKSNTISDNIYNEINLHNDLPDIFLDMKD